MDGHIPEELIEKVRASQDIVKVISGHISLKKSGQNYTGLCPFHSEKTPSFVVSPAKQLFHCFGCGTGGNIITFLMRYENIPFPEALRRLAYDAGIEIPSKDIKSGEKDKDEIFYEVNRLAADYYHEILKTAEEGGPARKYLHGRGLSTEVMERFNIGYSMNSWDNIYEYMKKKGFKEEILVKSGIVIPRNTGNGYYARFRGRIMFPIYDMQKRVVGFGGRVIDDTAPKYLNSPETPIFSKGHLLYGLDIALDSIRKASCAIIVEGYMDVISAHQAGISNTVGTLGTAFTANHLRVLNRFCKEAILTFDPDKAGISAAMRSVDIFVGSEVKARVLLLPEGKDPDSFIRKKGREFFLELAERSKGLIDFALDMVIDKLSDSHNDASIDVRVKVAEECLSIIRKIPNRIEQGYYLKRVSEELDIKEDILYAEWKRGNRDNKNSLLEKTNESVVNSSGTEAVLLTLVIKDRGLRKKAMENLSVEDFVDPQYRAVAEYVLNSDDDVHDIINSEGPDQPNQINQIIKNMVAKLAFNDLYVELPEKTLSDCIRSLHRKRLDRDLKEVEKEIASAETNGMYDRVNILLTKQGLLQRKRRLYENN